MQRLHQWAQQLTAAGHPIGQGRARQRYTVPGIDRALTIQRLMVAKLGHEYLRQQRSEEHTSELQSLMRISYAVFCLKKKKYKYRILVLLISSTKTTTYTREGHASVHN